MAAAGGRLNKPDCNSVVTQADSQCRHKGFNIDQAVDMKISGDKLALNS